MKGYVRMTGDTIKGDTRINMKGGADTVKPPTIRPIAPSRSQSSNKNRADEFGRRANILHSGDIINILSGTYYFQRASDNSQIIVGAPIAKTGTNLSKLRFERQYGADVSTSSTRPIRFGDTVYLKHNAYSNNQNQIKLIKYGDNGLQSHQEGELNREFKILNPENLGDTGYIEYDKDVFISRGEQETDDQIFLKVNIDKSIGLADIHSASRFKIALKRASEPNDRHLCICEGGILYP